MTSKTIIFTEEDLKEIEAIQFSTRDQQQIKLDGHLKNVMDLMKGRKFTTYEIVMNRLNINRRSARNWLEALKEKGFVNKQYAPIKCADSIRRKTALYYIVENEKDERRKKK